MSYPTQIDLFMRDTHVNRASIRDFIRNLVGMFVQPPILKLHKGQELLNETMDPIVEKCHHLYPNCSSFSYVIKSVGAVECDIIIGVLNLQEQGYLGSTLVIDLIFYR